jgi:hypothetical protein
MKTGHVFGHAQRLRIALSREKAVRRILIFGVRKRQVLLTESVLNSFLNVTHSPRLADAPTYLDPRCDKRENTSIYAEKSTTHSACAGDEKVSAGVHTAQGKNNLSQTYYAHSGSLIFGTCHQPTFDFFSDLAAFGAVTNMISEERMHCWRLCPGSDCNPKCI